MTETTWTLLAIAALLIVVVSILWFGKFRRKHREFIAPPKPLPVHTRVNPDWFETNAEGKVIWLTQPAETQPSANVWCVAYTLRSLMLAAPLRIANAPSVEKLFAEYTKRDDQKANDYGGNQIGAMKYLEEKGHIGGKAGFLTRILRTLGFRHAFFNFENIEQIKIYVKQFAPVPTAFIVRAYPSISADGILYAMQGDFAFHHSALIYGVDETMLCPDGSRGAFRVRWHLDWFGTDGWMPFTVAAVLLDLKYTYGIKSL